MLQVDFHTHTIFSKCGVHTHLEMLDAAAKKGLKGLAITDHGPALDARINSVFFERFECPCPGLRLIKGIECNITDDKGTIDCPLKYLAWMDIVLCGMHFNFGRNLDKQAATRVLVKAMERYPFIDIITHPNDTVFQLNFLELAKTASRLGIALEINNRRGIGSDVAVIVTQELLAACVTQGCRVAIGSDAHVITEIGGDESVRPILQEAGFPDELIVNNTEEMAYEFIKERRSIKERWLAENPVR